MSENNHSEQEDRREDAPSMNFGFEAFGSWESETCSGRRLQQYDLANHRQSYTRAFGDGPRNFEPWSSDVDDT
ncbi:hypothetical protein TNCV_3634511 [Trichonephila clavipes]|nr:hypothetical protein TNCV_3634511 [Trichonephila clavipes]